MDYMVGQTHVDKSDPEIELKYLDYRKDEAGGCGNICHASLLTVAGLASYAVYNGLDCIGIQNDKPSF